LSSRVCRLRPSSSGLTLDLAPAAADEDGSYLCVTRRRGPWARCRIGPESERL
jgi:hypothetical protein